MKKLNIYFYVILCLVLGSCSAEFDEVTTETDLPYLTFAEDTDVENLTKADYEVLSAAAKRVGLIVNEDGLYGMACKSAQEINVSEEIYQYFKRSLDRSNEYLKKYIGKERTDIISRSEIPGYTGINDCLSHAISHACDNYDYNTVSQILYDKFGGEGVPYDKLEETLRIFGPFYEVSPEFFTSPEFYNNKVIIILNGGTPGSLHAVNGLCTLEEVGLFINDFQRNELSVRIDKTLILRAFLLIE